MFVRLTNKYFEKGNFMENNALFKPSPQYKELMILSTIASNNDVSQRMLASKLNISLAMVNSYLIEAENNKYIKLDNSKRRTKYLITKLGLERIKVLNIGLLKSSLDVYNYAKIECEKFLRSIEDKGFKNILFYGAGEVAEILLYVLNNGTFDICVKAVIDDDNNKQGTKFVNLPIIPLSKVIDYKNIDGILVSSYTNIDIINKKLNDYGYDKSKILNFFE